jgi:hypothetical protein
MERKKFVKESAILCLILILLIFLINAVYMKYVLEKKIAYKKEAAYNDFISSLDNKTIDFAFFGDSHAEGDINPDYIPVSYNFALGLENYVSIYYKLNKVLEKDNIVIKNAVFEIDMHTFSDAMVSKGRVLDNLPLYSKFVTLSEIRKVRKDDSLLVLLLGIYFPVLGNGEDFKVLVLKDTTTIIKGFIANKGDFTQSDMDFSLENKYNIFFNQHERINPMAMEYFKKTIKLADERGINIIFIKYPIAKEFDEYISKRGIAKEKYYEEIFKEINSSIGEDYSVLDYYSYFNDSSNFLDPDHLNEKGSEAFSKQVNIDLVGI